MILEDTIDRIVSTPMSHVLFKVSGGVDDLNETRGSGPWKDGLRYAYNGHPEAWVGCWADILLVASEVLEEENS